MTRRPVNWQVPGVVTSVTDDESHVERSPLVALVSGPGQPAVRSRSDQRSRTIEALLLTDRPDEFGNH